MWLLFNNPPGYWLVVFIQMRMIGNNSQNQQLVLCHNVMLNKQILNQKSLLLMYNWPFKEVEARGGVTNPGR